MGRKQDQVQVTSSHMQDNEERVAGETVTDLLSRWRLGDRLAEETLMHRIYPHLHRLAAAQLARSRHVSLDPTELLHELYLKLVGSQQMDYESRAHFYGISSRLMRAILVDHARRKSSLKRGGGGITVELATVSISSSSAVVDILALDQALLRLKDISLDAVRVVELRYFGGLTVDEAAAAMGVGRATVVRTWRYARAWLKQALDTGLDTGTVRGV